MNNVIKVPSAKTTAQWVILLLILVTLVVGGIITQISNAARLRQTHEILMVVERAAKRADARSQSLTLDARLRARKVCSSDSLDQEFNCRALMDRLLLNVSDKQWRTVADKLMDNVSDQNINYLARQITFAQRRQK